jgi:hypothetical protein
VVVCGYDESSDCFVVRDPAVPPLDANESASEFPSRKSFVAASALETARRAFGTDEDLLLVRRRRDR